MKIKSKFRAKYKTVPYALDSKNRMIPPEKASKHESYRCPQCKKTVIVRKSKLKNIYFAHYRRGNCSIDRSAPTLAKHILYQKLQEWLSGKGPPIEVKFFLDRRYVIPPQEIGTIKLDHQVLISSAKSITAHLALFDNWNQLLVGIEFRPKKRAKSINQYPWLEIDPEECLENPYLLASLSTQKEELPFFMRPIQLSLNLDIPKEE
ncbi:competence protein CoiA family protein [Thermoflavimicrobium dichotomicum]|uniref:Competence protein CoiA-like family protein n=1 Tax=Thermoflavimicrobium dichotomicum TaxID=46223 RepID=A0A1I3PAC4_9BACL|nr:competence protein CoiA family protein [Thermoflavimicrobium dichotomicum]SFJ18534.1 Competence protein CoiA-like family protein [Thermoflavimicrobium dichotomicum]